MLFVETENTKTEVIKYVGIWSHDFQSEEPMVQL